MSYSAAAVVAQVISETRTKNAHAEVVVRTTTWE